MPIFKAETQKAAEFQEILPLFHFIDKIFQF